MGPPGWGLGQTWWHLLLRPGEQRSPLLPHPPAAQIHPESNPASQSTLMDPILHPSLSQCIPILHPNPNAVPQFIPILPHPTSQT